MNQFTSEKGTKRIVELFLGKVKDKEGELMEEITKDELVSEYNESELDYDYTIDGDQIILNKYKGDQTDVVVGNTYNVDGTDLSTKLTNDSSNLFTGNPSVEDITFEDGIDSSELTDMDNMFADCPNLGTVDMSNVDLSNVTTMDGTFKNNSNLQEVIMNNTLNTEGINTSNTFNNAGVSDFTIKDSSTGSDVTPISQLETSGVFIVNLNDPAVTNDAGLLITSARNATGPVLRIPSHYEKNGITYRTVLGGGFSIGDCSTNVSEIIIDDGVVLANNCSSLFAAASSTTKGHITKITIGDVATGYEITSQNASVVTTDTLNDNSMIRMFYKQYALTEITGIDNIDTSSTQYMTSMFQNCTGLTNLDLTTFNTTNVTDMSYMFNNCSSMQEILVTRGLWVTDQATTTDMFNLCGVYKVTYVGETEVDPGATIPPLSDFTYFHNTTLNLIYLQKYKGTDENIRIPAEYDGVPVAICAASTPTSSTGVFSNCVSLKSITFDDGVQFTQNRVAYMLYNCTNLETVTFGSVDTSTVTSFYAMFSGCSSLSQINGLTNIDTSAATTLYQMFYNCPNISSLDLTSFDTSKVTNTNYMFAGCTNLSEILVSDTWTTAKVSSSNQKYMFLNCGVSSVTVVEKPVDCIIPPLEDFTHGISEDGSEVTISKYNGTARGIIIPGAIDGMRVILKNAITTGDGIFNATVKSIIIDDGVILAAAVQNLFGNCTALQNITFGKVDTSRVTSMNGMFRYCSALSNISGIENFDTSSVTDMSNMFISCTQLGTIDLSHFDTTNVTTMANMFSSCSSLSSLTIGSWDTSAVTNMSGMFQSCSALTDVDLHTFDTTKVQTMMSMFDACSSLTSLNLTSFDTTAVINMKFMFRNASALKEILVSNTWSTSQISSTNLSNMFTGCGVSNVTVV